MQTICAVIFIVFNSSIALSPRSVHVIFLFGSNVNSECRYKAAE